MGERPSSLPVVPVCLSFPTLVHQGFTIPSSPPQEINQRLVNLYTLLHGLQVGGTMLRGGGGRG